MMNGVVQISCLGSLGRFGNQLFQYAIARGYAESVGARLETPPWVGQTLFGLSDPPIQQYPNMVRLGLEEIPKGQTNIDLYGYFQHSDCFQFYTLSKLREWFKFKDEWNECFLPDRVALACHIRMGDYTSVFSGIFCAVAEECYRAAMKKHGYDPTLCVVVSEENPHPFPMFDLVWLKDFFILMQAKVLFRANSTFSWWAATLGNHDKVFSPLIEGKKGLHNKDIEFVEGNWPRCVSLPQVSDYHIKP